MAIEYLGLSNINGPLVVLEGIQDAFFRRDCRVRGRRQHEKNGPYRRTGRRQGYYT